MEIDEYIKALKQLKHDIEENGDIEDHIEINFERKADETIKLPQPHLIQQIIDGICMSTRLVNKDDPATSSKISCRFSSDPKLEKRFHCRRMISKLNVLE